MAFLGRPSLGLNTPSRPSPTSPGTVRVDIAIPLFFERLEGCFVRTCPEAVRDPIYQIQAEVWASDVNEPAGTVPINAPNSLLFRWTWSANNSTVKRIVAGDIASGSAVSGNPSLRLLNLSDTATLAESSLNEDWGPFPPAGKPALKQTRDELFLRVYLSTVFSSWQPIQTIDSNIETGQFFGP